MSFQAGQSTYCRDFHIHASGYRVVPRRGHRNDADMTVPEITRYCVDLGYRSIGIIEHLEPQGPHPVEECLSVVRDVRALPASSACSVHAGCEVSIMDSGGTLSASSNIIADAGLEYVIASIHSVPTSPRSLYDYFDVAIDMMVSAIEKNSGINVLGHPWRDTPKILSAHGLQEPFRYSLIPDEHLDRLIACANANSVLLEISLKRLAEPDYRKFISRLLNRGARFSIGSDAHCRDHIFQPTQIEQSLTDLGITPDNIGTPVHG